MAKLYPPYLEGTLPAFCLTDLYGIHEYNKNAIYDKNDRVFVSIPQDDGTLTYNYYSSKTSNNIDHNPIESVDYWERYWEGDGEIIIPFEHNKAVSPSDVNNIIIKVKSIQNDELVMGGITGEYDAENKLVRLKVHEYEVYKQEIKKLSDGTLEQIESTSGWTVTIGQFYKIQIAYIAKDENDSEGYYSTVGVIKCTSMPRISIEGLYGDGYVNSARNVFIGQFRQVSGSDCIEKVYSSTFEVKDLDGNIIKEARDVLHNVQNNPDSYSSSDEFDFGMDLPVGELYTIQYSVVTNNNLRIASEEYLITQQLALSAELQSKLVATFNLEDGYTQLDLIGYVDENGTEEWGDGIFLLAREDSLYPNVWEELYHFSLNYEAPTKMIFKDFTVEQGKHYRYSIQRVNKFGIYSDRIKSNTIYADFDDIFIYDGERQLKLRFNPQVSSLKTQLAETKTDTIGSKYPFFFRNPKVGYRIIPISGLLSMLSDDNEYFTTYEDILRERDNGRERHNSYAVKTYENDYSNHDDGNGDSLLIDDFVYKKHKEKIPHNYLEPNSANYVSERLFREKVLAWLNNGKVKLFRSPAEGNALVRFMETSLSPQQPLGRMLYSVNTTGYECADCNYDNYVKYHIVEKAHFTAEDFDYRIESWKEFNLFTDKESSIAFHGGVSENLLKTTGSKIYTTTVKFSDFLPGIEIVLVFNPIGTYGAENSETIIIGSSGSYEVNKVAPIYGIYIKETDFLKEAVRIGASCKVLFQYKTSLDNTFDNIIDARSNTSDYRQFVGNITIPDAVNDFRLSMGNICVGKISKRPLEYIFYDESYQSFIDSIMEPISYSSSNLPLYHDYWLEDKEIYSRESNMHRSPFCLYVLRNNMLNGEKIVGPANAKDNTLKDNHSIFMAMQDNHIFERYYIDSLLRAEPSPEEIVLKSLAQARTGHIESKLVILDAWNNTLIPINDYNSYDCNMYINGKQINLMDLEYYEIANIDLTIGNKITIGNGLYADLYFQDLTKTFLYEDALEEKINWLEFVKATKAKHYTSEEDLIQENQLYREYLNALNKLITMWSQKEV